MQLALVVSGNQADEAWKEKAAKTDFYFLKAQVETVLDRLGYNMNNLHSAESQNDIFDYALHYDIQNSKDNFTELVHFGKVKDKLLRKFEIEQDVFYAEFNWNVLMDKARSNVKYQEPSKFPVVRRDLALLIDNSVQFNQIKEAAFKSERRLLTKVNLFDVFTDAKLGENKKSYALSFYLQDNEKTLNDKQIDKVMEKLIKTFTSDFDAQLR
jgi:phenylalanyl-tRNA synthetase beta chain